MEETEVPETNKVQAESSSRKVSVDDYLRSIGAMEYSEDSLVKLEYVGHGEFDERFKRHGQKSEVSPPEAENLLGLSDDDGALFKRV